MVKINYSCIRCSREKKSEKDKTIFCWIDDVCSVSESDFPKDFFKDGDDWLCEHCVLEMKTMIANFIMNKKNE